MRVGNDYFIAVSAFEWFLEVMIYHSYDLSNCEFVCAPLDDDRKVEDSNNPLTTTE